MMTYTLMLVLSSLMLYSSNQGKKGRAVFGKLPATAGVVIFGLLAFSLAIYKIVFNLTPETTAQTIKSNLLAEELAAEYLGEYLAKNYKNRRTLILTYPDINKTYKRRNAALLKGLKKGINKQLRIMKTVYLPYEKDYIFGTKWVTPDNIDTAILENPGCELVILLAGLPVEKGDLYTWSMGDKRPKIACYRGTTPQMLDAIDLELVDVWLTFKPGVRFKGDYNEEEIKDRKKFFEDHFLFISKGNLAKQTKGFFKWFKTRTQKERDKKAKQIKREKEESLARAKQERLERKKKTKKKKKRKKRKKRKKKKRN